jgi:hypothetical protein
MLDIITPGTFILRILPIINTKSQPKAKDRKDTNQATHHHSKVPINPIGNRLRGYSTKRTRHKISLLWSHNEISCCVLLGWQCVGVLRRLVGLQWEGLRLVGLGGGD